MNILVTKEKKQSKLSTSYKTVESSNSGEQIGLSHIYRPTRSYKGKSFIELTSKYNPQLELLTSIHLTYPEKMKTNKIKMKQEYNNPCSFFNLVEDNMDTVLPKRNPEQEGSDQSQLIEQAQLRQNRHIKFGKQIRKSFKQEIGIQTPINQLIKLQNSKMSQGKGLKCFFNERSNVSNLNHKIKHQNNNIHD